MGRLVLHSSEVSGEKTRETQGSIHRTLTHPDFVKPRMNVVHCGKVRTGRKDCLFVKVCTKTSRKKNPTVAREGTGFKVREKKTARAYHSQTNLN